MSELAFHCTIYFSAEKAGETMEEIAERLENILRDEGLDYQCYDMELRET